MKKFLSLVLALVMVLSLGVTAGAVDFTDEAAITKEEAVGVLSGVGIINGYEAADGTYSFAPNGNITRGAAAKIIAMIKLGTKVSALLTCETAPFKDVAKDSTFAPYIAYCVNEGIVSGYADGTYKPGNPVSGYAFTKMLLNALGIKGDYEGANYGVNVALAADEAGLFEGMDADTVYSANCIREDACQLAFNALTYTPDGAKSQYVVTKNGEEVYKGTDALTALVMAQAGGTLTLDTTYTGSLGDKHFGLQDSTATDNFGRTSKTWTNGETGTKKVTYASIAPDAKLTYTTATTYTKIATALGATNATAVKLTVVEDGVRGTQRTVYKNSTTTTLGIESLNIGGQGTLVEVYQVGEASAKTYDVVVINTYVKKLADATNDFIKANADTETKAAIVLETGLTYETTAFKKDDVVLYTKGYDTVEDEVVIDNVVKAAYITGKVTAVAGDNSYFRVDGVQYKKAAQNAATVGTTAGYKYNKNDTTVYTYYLDNYNNVIMVDTQTPEEAKVNYVYVIEGTTSYKAGTTAGNSLFESSPNNTAAAQVRVIDLATGAISVKNIGLVKKTDGSIVYATSTGAASSTAISTTSGDTTLGGILSTGAGIYSYVELTDGSIVLGAEASGDTVTVKKDTALLKTKTYANSATKLSTIEYTTDKDGKVVSATVTTKTGIANFPKDGGETAVDLLIVDSKTNIASEIVIVKAKTVVETTKYAIYNGAGETDSTGSKYAFYVNGAVVEYVVSTATGATVDVTGMTKGATVVNYTLKDGKLFSVAAATNKIGTALKVVAVDATFFVVENTSTKNQVVIYYNTNGCTVVDAGATFAVDTLTVGDIVDIYGSVDSNGKATADFAVIAKVQ